VADLLGRSPTGTVGVQVTRKSVEAASRASARSTELDNLYQATLLDFLFSPMRLLMHFTWYCMVHIAHHTTWPREDKVR
jgi:hypothetical protein